MADVDDEYFDQIPASSRAFIADVVRVCRWHGMYLEPGDVHAGMSIYPLEPDESFPAEGLPTLPVCPPLKWKPDWPPAEPKPSIARLPDTASGS